MDLNIRKSPAVPKITAKLLYLRMGMTVAEVGQVDLFRAYVRGRIQGLIKIKMGFMGAHSKAPDYDDPGLPGTAVFDSRQGSGGNGAGIGKV